MNDQDDYLNDLMAQTVQRAQRIEGAVGSVNFDAEDVRAAFEEEVMAALQALYPVSIDSRRLRENAGEIQQAIVAIGERSIRL